MATYFAAPMTCPHCGAVSPADTSTAMATGLINEPGVHVLRVGDVVPKFRAAVTRELVPLRPLPDHGPIVVLQEWYCAPCDARRFAHVVFDEDGRVERIEAVPITRATLDAAHLAYDGLAEFYQDVVGEPLYVDDALRPDFVARLRAALPDENPKW